MSVLLGGGGEGGLMRGIKVTQQDIALKMQGAGAYLRDTMVLHTSLLILWVAHGGSGNAMHSWN